MLQSNTKPPTVRRKHDSREIRQRIVIAGTLELLSPTHLGNGDAEGLTDLPLLLDDADERPAPLLTGASLAGALRNYVRLYEKGFYQAEESQERDSLTVCLFGMVKGDTGDPTNQSDQGGDQSRLIVDDALGALPDDGIEVRDGVRINVATRTAEDKFKYDLELLPAGTTFDLRFELLIGAGDDEAKLKQTLALALHGLESGAITLGARKSRGFGRCRVRHWQATTYNLTESRADLLAWLAADHPDWGYAPTKPRRTGTIAEVLVAPPEERGKRSSFTITANFALESPLLIRSEEPLGDDDNQPDFVHIRNGKGEPILPGTSLAGALRARATRILNTIKPDSTQPMIDSLFGKDMQRDPLNPTASRLIVEEVPITGGTTLVQNRVAIDRFTGGGLDTALFAEAPQVGGAVTLKLTIRDHPELKPERLQAERGLLLLLLKDLWTGDVPLGGTSSIGRGRLRGLHATIEQQAEGSNATWTIDQEQEKLIVGDAAREQLEKCVKALHDLEATAYANNR